MALVTVVRSTESASAIWRCAGNLSPGLRIRFLMSVSIASTIPMYLTRAFESILADQVDIAFSIDANRTIWSKCYASLILYAIKTYKTSVCMDYYFYIYLQSGRFRQE